MKRITALQIRKIYRPRKPDAHKGNHGHALLIAGSKDMMGAAIIAAKACLRAGVGLLTVNIPAEATGIVQTVLPEAMVMTRNPKTLGLERFSCIGIGPGLGTVPSCLKLLKSAFIHYRLPMVIDADALNIISAHPSLWQLVPPNSIITPHPKEFDRLFGNHENAAARIETAIQKAASLSIAIVLKGNNTLVTNGKRIFYNRTGNAGLAKGGSGDALTGIIASFMAQGYAPFEAAMLGVYLHGLAADLALERQSQESMLISDVIDYLGSAFKTIAT